MQDLRDFRETESSIIRWYTDEGFFHKMINNTIRVDDTEVVF